MTPDELLSLADNPDLIEGIYNYCDRWCERCPMTHRCMVYLTLPKDDDLPADNPEEHTRTTLKHVEDSFSLTMQLLQKLADERGIDLTMTPEEDAVYRLKHAAMRQEVDNSRITRLANEYLKLGKKWLHASNPWFAEKTEELQHAAWMQLSDRNPEQEALALKEAIDVIQYYIYQITVKIMRAQSGRIRNKVWEDEDGGFPKDADGSAKVALLGIDRSIGAWGILLQSLPDQEESILDLLTLLERLRRMVEEEFPKARAFVRPGFDDGGIGL